MGPHRRGILLLPIVSLVACLPSDPALADEWCDKKRGCTHWETFYDVYIGPVYIQIRYRNADQIFFKGIISKSSTGGTIVTGKIKGIGDVEAKIAGKTREEFADIEKIKNLEVQGTLAKQGSAGGGQQFEGAITPEKLDWSVTGTVKGTITGKIKGGEKIEGPFEGSFEVPKERWHIKGAYTPPPGECSGGPGGQEIAVWRYNARQVRTDAEWEARNTRLKANPSTEGKREATAEKSVKAKAEDLPIGKYGRWIDGTMNAEKDEITLNLPPLPILNEKCQVMGTTEKMELTLVKQEPSAPK